MRPYKAAYVAAIFLAGFGAVAAIFVYPYGEVVFITLGQAILAVLTFPLGAVASAIGAILIYLGIATPAETTFLTTPAYAVLGYLQWCRLIPAFYRAKR